MSNINKDIYDQQQDDLVFAKRMIQNSFFGGYSLKDSTKKYIKNIEKQRMTLEEHREAVNKTIAVLDTIDFIPFLKESDDLDFLRAKMSNVFDDTELTNNEYMKGYLFNVITDEELVNYLKERYKDDIIIYDYTCYKIECKKNDAPKDKFIKELIDGYNMCLLNLQEVIEAAIKHGKEEAKSYE